MLGRATRGSGLGPVLGPLVQWGLVNELGPMAGGGVWVGFVWDEVGVWAVALSGAGVGGAGLGLVPGCGLRLWGRLPGCLGFQCVTTHRG